MRQSAYNIILARIYETALSSLSVDTIYSRSRNPFISSRIIQLYVFQIGKKRK